MLIEGSHVILKLSSFFCEILFVHRITMRCVMLAAAGGAVAVGAITTEELESSTKVRANYVTWNVIEITQLVEKSREYLFLDRYFSEIYCIHEG